MSKYELIEKELDEREISLVDLCKEKGLNYKSIKNGLYRYRKSKDPKVTPTQVSTVTYDTVDTKTKKKSDNPSKPKKNKEITFTQLIELAHVEMNKDPQNTEYQTFIKRFTGKDAYLLRTTVKLVNSLKK